LRIGKVDAVESFSTTKIAHKTNPAKNRLHDKTKNRTHDSSKYRPDIIKPVSLCGVIDEFGLKALLKAHAQTNWCTRVRLQGLLLLIDYICRHLKNGTVTISSDLAHSFVSKLRIRNSEEVPTEPLLLLCKVGILRKVRPAVFAHIRSSAVYRFTNSYVTKRISFEVTLPPKLMSKLQSADARREKRLNRRYPFRRQLLVDLKALSFSSSARPVIAHGLGTEGSDNLKRLISAIDGPKHFVRVSERGQITTSISSCPRELRPHLLLRNEPTVSCDISHAHWNFLPLILANRLHHVEHEPAGEDYVRQGWREHDRLISLLNRGDFYREWCVDPQNDQERDEKKGLLNILLNMRNEKCEQNVLYRRIRDRFPITFRTIEDLKRNDHRNLSKQLHRFTADTIAAALLELQGQEIAAIPQVDALICQARHRTTVCEAIGKQIFQSSGVCCSVVGIRYSPLNEAEKRALAFDEIAPSDDGMTYDEWEAARRAKGNAALKLMRASVEACSPVGCDMSSRYDFIHLSQQRLEMVGNLFHCETYFSDLQRS